MAGLEGLFQPNGFYDFLERSTGFVLFVGEILVRWEI